MRIVTRDRWLALLIWASRLTVAAVFIVAALPKLADPGQFSLDIQNYQAFPSWAWTPLAFWVPSLELIGAFGLLVGWKRRAAAIVLGGLTVGFIVLILTTIVRGVDVNCGCFGALEQASAVGWSLFWRDVGLLILVVIAALRVPSGAASR